MTAPAFAFHMRRACVFACVLALSEMRAEETPAPAAASGGAVVFQNGSEGFHTFRIPAAITTKSGAVLAFGEGRVKSASDAGDIDLVLRRSEDGGQTWSPPQVIWNDGGNACCNPCPVLVEETGEIVLLAIWKHGGLHEKTFREGKNDPNGGSRPCVLRSRDEGRTWSAPEDISATADRPEWLWYAVGPGNGIELKRGAHQGRLVIPANHSSLVDGQHQYNAHALLSDDRGKTWRISRGTIAPGANESTVAELNDGTLLFNTRMQTHGEGKRGIARSRDGGETWADFHHDPHLTCPVCEASLIRIEPPAGTAASAEKTESSTGSANIPADAAPTWLLFSNPQGGGRSGLTVQLSPDSGATWPRRLLIDPGKSYGYSSLTVLDAHTIGILYEGAPGPTGGILWKTFSLGDLR